MAKVVLVHGIDQQQKSAEVLEAAWLPALARGVRTAGFPAVADLLWRTGSGPGGIEARMAFYGHLFRVPGQQGDEPPELGSEEQRLAEELGQEWLERAARQASKKNDRETATRELAFLRREIGEEEAGVGAVARSVIQSLARVPWFAKPGMFLAERFVKRALAQVTRYLTDEPTRAAAQKTVLDLMGSETVALAAHSLGSVVAYEVAARLDRPLPLLLTFGSPLGLNTIVYPRLRPQPPVYPAAVGRWVNVADRDDFIAAAPDLSAMFGQGVPAGAKLEGGYTVDNGADPHRADFYLGKEQVGRPLGEALRQ